MIKTLKIKTKRKNYNVIIGTKTLINIHKYAKINNRNVNIAIIDKIVLKKYKKYIEETLKRNNVKIIKFDSTEKQKSLNGYNKLSMQILKLNPNRKSKVIIIGGGVAGDLGGFVASTIFRGLELILVPTTLLSQVDSSIGGKNGINTIFGKNLIGSFYQPNVVIIDTFFLKSLSKRELKSGYAEILKHSLIKNIKYFNWLESNYHRILKLKNPYITKAIYESIKIKSYFVSKDENEKLNSKYSRALLNFGHTFGHAFEAINRYNKKLTHGEAVAIGIHYAIKISRILSYLPKNDFLRIEDHLIKSGFNINIKKINFNKIYKYLLRDKKNKNNLVRFVLLKKIGDAFLSNGYKMENLKEIYSKLN